MQARAICHMLLIRKQLQASNKCDISSSIEGEGTFIMEQDCQPLRSDDDL